MRKLSTIWMMVMVATAATAVLAGQPVEPILPTDPGQSARARGEIPASQVLSPEPLGESRADTERAAQLILSGQSGQSGTQGPAGATGARGPQGPKGAGLSKEAFARFLRETGGSSATWSKPQVEKSLQRGSDRGGLDGRRKGAKSADGEWQAATTRQELAVVAERGASYAERLLGGHNADPNAHGGRIAQIPWIWLALVLVLLVAIGGYFFPRIRMPRPGGY